ncbi:proteasome activator pa28, REG alpha/beta subunit [Fomitiporia mediterranea MF3/22]|uniref:proteasome activator pa28, REG alpha/beta subunit n=1 Tax=Fomitiporia mediterranea (strain MF3/22) TaxID=694068 RepID=UPI00044089AA|nr:proteasome activator pa28, REG alpha/beta subunit [Fomitiporia mediterranea MF3/22]EJD03669.1 proteasome activator pa28, REG alpha/beta subunit [Fomitiporia mediterranea MF3/22]
MSMSPGLTQKLEAYHEKVAANAENVVFTIFPQKILDLQEQIDSSSDPSSIFHLSHAATSTDATVYPGPSREQRPDSKKRKVADGASQNTVSTTENARYAESVHANKHIEKVHAHLKKECEELARLCDDVSIWIQLTMPKIEDGDNFGVAVQEEALAELNRCQQSAYNLRDTARQHHQTRAKICSKIIKYPNVEDYPLALKEHDEKMLYTARSNLFDLRNLYAVMTNIFQKNIAKIRAPKGNNSVALY